MKKINLNHKGTSRMHRYAFIIPKPLPFMVSASIIDQLAIGNSSDILLVTTFAGAREFANQYMSSDQRWGRLKTFSSLPEAYKYARDERYEHLFIDSDVGVRKMVTLLGFRLRSPGTTISVYEEGIGTYRTDLYHGFKKLILPYLGIATVFGGSPFIDSIYVYDTELYGRHIPPHALRARKITPQLIGFINHYMKELSSLFRMPHEFSEQVGGHCQLYLTNWEVDRTFMEYFEKLPGMRLLKPHPHFQHFPGSDPALRAVQLVPAHLPAELLILNLALKHSSLTIYHHGSSAAHYTSDTGPMFIKV